jgi:3',5'-cyclic AMP phosphodiesterase CpdA
VTARFLHVSDLHLGAGREAEIEENLDLELIVASGDLTSPAWSKVTVRPSPSKGTHSMPLGKPDSGEDAKSST